ncbi:MAG: homoserine dehydrogenase [Candidatus Omnitrophica bacterium]|nr:homoserine dehydrogenase [Candidatus Omnitrophota bacterium]MCM8803561.1 homoserine dehydrogenase [Candidatus Omnitrophota bacterium]
MDRKSVNIGVIGCGTVGSSFVKNLILRKEIIKRKTEIEINILKVFDKDKSKIAQFKNISANSPDEIIENKEIDIVVELIGGTDDAYKFVKRAIENRKSIVTANKALLSKFGYELFKKSKEKNVYIGFEASVAGSIPIIKSLKESFLANKINKILGILNGTTNFILSEMYYKEINFNEGVEKAKRLGYAEADPTLDIKGYDTAHKILILAYLISGEFFQLDEISVEGIDKIEPIDIKFASEFGYRIKLLGICKKEDKKIEIRVHPALLPKSHLLSLVEGVNNAIYVEGDLIGKSLFYGEGAGGNAASSSIISDVVDISKKIVHKGFVEENFISDIGLYLKPFEEIETNYYFRFTAIDKPGVLAKISKILGDNNISILSVIQKQDNPEKAVPIIMLTHKAKEKNVKKAIKEIDKLDVIRKPTITIRLEQDIM